MSPMNGKMEKKIERDSSSGRLLAIAWLDIEGTFPKAQAADACLPRKPSDSRHYPLINLPPQSLDF